MDDKDNDNIFTRDFNKKDAPVFRHTVKPILKNPLLEAMGIKSEKATKYCRVLRMRLPVSMFYAKSPVEDAKTLEDLRAVCVRAWDQKVIDPDTNELVKASGNSKYDDLVREKLKGYDPLKEL